MELTLFIIVGAIAVISAAMMLITENAVYSALYLILNFACIAFFFLMLRAPFLAMVQITVYAGAIMVLFLFVIMLLGAERVEMEVSPRFPWLAPAAMILALIFLIVTGITIIRGDINRTEARIIEPQFRVVNALEDDSAIDVYLNGTQVAESVAVGGNTEFQALAIGIYTASLFAAGADPAAGAPLVEQNIELNSGEAISLVAVGTAQTVRLAVATEDVNPVENKDRLRAVIVNGLPGRALIDVLDISHKKEVLASDIAFGEASEPVEITEGTYSIGAYPNGDTNSRLALIEDQELRPNTAHLWIFSQQRRPDNAWTNRVITLETRTRASFGGPAFVGQQLFSRYVLPFEMVALVLLVAMIGALILTQEGMAQRRQLTRRLANPPADVQPSGTPEDDRQIVHS